MSPEKLTPAQIAENKKKEMEERRMK